MRIRIKKCIARASKEISLFTLNVKDSSKSLQVTLTRQHLKVQSSHQHPNLLVIMALRISTIITVIQVAVT
jgi:hypothetical protein